MNARCCMDLSLLLACDIGNVIRSFAPVGADQLHETLDEFFGAEEGEEGEERRVKREDLALLLHMGADVDGLVDGDTALMKAVLATSLEALEMLVEAGVGIGVRDSNGDSVLHVAGIPFEIAEFLVSSGMDVNVENRDGRQPLSLAAQRNQTDLIDLYLQHGADIHAADEEGDTALHVTAMTGHRDAAQLLLDRVADCDVTNKKGVTSLLGTIIPYGDAPTDHRDVAELLISRGANVSHANDGGISILHHAAVYRSTDVLELLLENKADLYATDDRGWTALHYVAETCPVEGQVEEKKLRIAQFLVSRGIDTGAVTIKEHMAHAIAEMRRSQNTPIRTFLAGTALIQQQQQQQQQQQGQG
uniref:Uncharacterized protein n=1 Tax=Chromera velia CCMP2878 TaxID=1169474 RepID=A0A0G4F8J8_9ALVE|eukprot:Cvel_15583.t1-p1 / transcript=Cvel_15583.t1 / gene=Cvel_15583 / organism=Chromera_velia_CCMP2878 / gene_product=Putative ankyrin repeat protein MM_0045, putative / transcript_product=Putative ankyrin repeat protein MM_0045, putative / location=Cvel_scaffold1159:1376-2452(-) / protein_length=359 / sequence_SO=supercontig / SO=protein_coding / is_pseudo=false